MRACELPQPGHYVREWRSVLDAPKEQTFSCRKLGRLEPMTRDEAREWFVAALQNRINTRGGLCLDSRKRDPDWQRAALQDSRALRCKLRQRVRVYQFRTSECRRRFGHLLDRYDD